MGFLSGSLATSINILVGSPFIILHISFTILMLCHTGLLTAGDSANSSSELYVILLSSPSSALHLLISSINPYLLLRICMKLSFVSHIICMIDRSSPPSGLAAVIPCNSFSENLPQPVYPALHRLFTLLSLSSGYFFLSLFLSNSLSAPNNVISFIIPSLSSYVRLVSVSHSLKSL